MRRLALAFALVLASASVSRADLIAFEWSGTINQQIGFSPDLVGKAITGSYTLDTAATGGDIVKEITAEWEGNTFIVANSSPTDVDSFTAIEGSPGGDNYFVGIAPGTGTYNGTIPVEGAVIFGFGDIINGGSIDSLPTPSAINPLIGTFQLAQSAGGAAVGALITNVSRASGATAVPEPLSGLLFAVGGLIVGGAVRRKLEA